ncbi:hypothetical protein DRQ25_17660 [Candidatus Fermentibacteria bacterium]|nr:MAG: hypothetical protein DRQ25_17660 [Candidatus Fermentibacteria bacterium]
MNQVVDEKPLTIAELKSIVQQIKKNLEEQDEIFQKFNEHPEKIELLTSAEVPLCEFYELSFSQHGNLASSIPEIGNELPNIISAENRVEATKSLEELPPPDWLTNEIGNVKSANFLAWFFSLMFSIRAVQVFGIPMNVMIQMVREKKTGWRTALADAIRVDPSCLGCRSVATRLAIARLSGDRSVSKILLNAIRSPRLEKPDDFGLLRYVLHLLSDTGDIKSMTEEDKYNLICVELELYPIDGADPARSLSQFIRRWNKYPVT